MTALEGLVLNTGGEVGQLYGGGDGGTPVGSTMQHDMAREYGREHGFPGNWECGRADGGHGGGHGRNAAGGRIGAGDAGGSAGREHDESGGEQGAADGQVTTSVSILNQVNQETEGVAAAGQRLGWVQLQQYDIRDVGWTDQRGEFAFCGELQCGEHGAGADGGDYVACNGGRAVPDFGAGDGGDADAADDQWHR